MNTDTFNMATRYVFDAPLKLVWKAWSDPKMVKQWWGPQDFTAPVVNMNFQEGGVSLVCMRSPDGHDIYNTWTYHKIEPMERIEFTLNFTDKDGNQLDPAELGMPPGIPKDVPHATTLKNQENGKTEVTVTEYGYTSEQAAQMSKQGMDQCLDKMAAFKSFITVYALFITAPYNHGIKRTQLALVLPASHLLVNLSFVFNLTFRRLQLMRNELCSKSSS